MHNSQVAASSAGDAAISTVARGGNHYNERAGSSLRLESRAFMSTLACLLLFHTSRMQFSWSMAEFLCSSEHDHHHHNAWARNARDAVGRMHEAIACWVLVGARLSVRALGAWHSGQCYIPLSPAKRKGFGGARHRQPNGCE